MSIELSPEDLESLTPLQRQIYEVMRENPDMPDEMIAEIVFKKNHPDEEYKGKNPTAYYVGRLRKRFQFLSEKVKGKPLIEVEKEEVEEEEEELGEEEIGEEEVEEAEEEEYKPSLLSNYKFIIQFTFDRIAQFTGWDGWRLDPNDPNDSKFIDLTAQIIDKYSPTVVEKWGLELIWGYTALMTLLPRIQQYRQWRKSRSLIKKAEEEGKLKEKTCPRKKL